MRFFLDTEFNAEIRPTELISIGITSEDDRNYYAVSSEFDPSKCDKWLRENVLSRLGSEPTKSLDQIKDEIQYFVGGKAFGQPEFWGYFADWDWFLLGQEVFGGMFKMPSHWPNLCMDVKQYAIHLGEPRCRFQKQPPDEEHNALNDAIWTKDYWRYLKAREKSDLVCSLCGDNLRNQPNF